MRVYIMKKIMPYKRIIDKVFDSVYYVAYRVSPGWILNDDTPFVPMHVGGRFWYADPIPVEINGQIYVFMEQYDRIREIGHISVSHFTDNKLSHPVTVINEPFHLSFPMIIPYKGCYYMIPETGRTYQICIYKMTESIYNWKPYAKLKVNELLADIIYWIQDGVVFLLGGAYQETEPLYTRQKLFQLNNLDNPEKISISECWTSSEKNLFTRNAGQILNYDGEIYRVGQESTEDIYGRNLVFNKFVKVDVDDGIVEQQSKRCFLHEINLNINRGIYNDYAMHTYGRLKTGFEVIDVQCKVKIPSLIPLFRKMHRMYKKRNLL